MKDFENSHLWQLNTDVCSLLIDDSAESSIREFIACIDKSPKVLFVNGSPGAGKSHIAAWMSRRILEVVPDQKIGVETAAIPEFEDADQFSLIVLDDLERLVADPAESTGLTRLISQCLERRISLILVSDVNPIAVESASLELVQMAKASSKIALSNLSNENKLRLVQVLLNGAETPNISDSKKIISLNSLREIEAFVHRSEILKSLNENASLV